MDGALEGFADETGRFTTASRRVVGRQFVLEVDEREHFRMLMRMCEKFTGCRVLSYCLMSNHFHLLLEVPPMPEGGISDAGVV